MKLRSLSVVVALVGLAGAVAAGCGGSDFAAGPASGAAGVAGSDVGGASAGSITGSSGHAGQANAGSNSGGAGASSGGGSEAGAIDEPAGEAGVGGVAGTSTGGVSNAGTGGSNTTGGTLGSAGAAGGDDQSGGMGGCTAVSWFPDGDGDGYGRSSGVVVACDAPTNGTWVLQGGDCNDDNNAVFPHNPGFYSDGYITAGNVTSFDYDCSSMEEEDPTARGAAPDCSGLLSCPTGADKSGFQSTGRTGSGVNPLCGSKNLVMCTGSAVKCSALVSVVTSGVPCH
jgi:hypothetical protein